MAYDIDDSRRQFLLRALAVGWLANTPSAWAGLLGNVPRALPAGQSVYSIQGDFRVNGQPATAETLIGPNDTVTTGRSSQAVFVVGKDAFILRENSELHLSGSELLVDAMRLVTGGLLSVFGKRSHRIETPTSYIGIRGTGIYVEASSELSYICTCYGTVDISAAQAPANNETIESRHHDAPRYVTADGKIRPAPMIDHTDDELMLVETLVGRTPPFALFDDSYGGPKRY